MVKQPKHIYAELLDKADAQLQIWLDNGYRTDEVRGYADREAMLETINERGHDAIDTMHSDDPSRIQFLDELEKLEKLVERGK